MAKSFFTDQASQLNIMAKAIFALFMSLMVITGPSFVAGTYDAPAKTTKVKEHASMTLAKTALSKEDYSAALGALAIVIADEPNNADAWNLTGFSHRKSGNYGQSKIAYEKALTIDPKHKGALEYMGELYLTLGDLPKAEELLRRLKNACSFFCEERDDLKKAIKAYKKENG